MSAGPNLPLILLVDDDLTERVLAREALELEGFEVAEAGDGLAALEVFDGRRPDIVLMDVRMPRMDGFDCCAALRARPEGADVPVLMITGLEDMESIRRAYDVGATDFATKPVNWLVLGQRVRYMLRAAGAFNELERAELQLRRVNRVLRVLNACGDMLLTSEDERGLLREGCRILVEIGGYRGAWVGVVDPRGGVSGEPVAAVGLCGEGRDAACLQGLGEADDGAALREAMSHHRPHVVNGEEASFIALPLLGGGDLKMLVVGSAEADAFDEEERAQLVKLADELAYGLRYLQDQASIERLERHASYLAYHDTLTDLPNRKHLMGSLRLEIGERADGEALALVCFDVDGLSRINSSHGLAVGDQLLVAFAKRLREGAGKGMVARLDGDKFALLLSPVGDGVEAARICEALFERLAAPFVVEGREFVVGTSAGIALHPADAADSDGLIKSAQAALQVAKRRRKGVGYQFASQELERSAERLMALEHDLRKAVEHGKLALHYQPQVAMASGEVVGMEALVRWPHADRGLVAPAEFIPLAEESGLIVPLGEWVMREACRQLSQWRSEGLPARRVAVNVSPRQFEEGNLVELVETLLRESGLDGSQLELEVTEGSVMDDPDGAIVILRELKALGVWLAMDDFGTGYSSLSYLQRFPFDTVKIDQSFIRQMIAKSDSAAIVSSIIAMTRTLNLKVLAEGVEEQAQWQFLVERACDEVQGFLFSRPLPAGEMARLLRRGRLD